MYSTNTSGSFTEFDAAYAFASVYGESFVGGTDTAINNDPTKKSWAEVAPGIGRLVAFFGLEQEPGCLAFHESRGPIGTGERDAGARAALSPVGGAVEALRKRMGILVSRVRRSTIGIDHVA